MTRTQLEHIIRASAMIADDSDIVVVDSQAVLGQFPDAPGELLISREADVYPMNYPERADLIDGGIGEGSPFEATFGYYAHGVGEETSTLPEGWKSRLVRVENDNTRGVRGWCLDVHDLAIAKLIAGPEKDLAVAASAARHDMVDRETLRLRLEQTAIPNPVRQLVLGRTELLFC